MKKCFINDGISGDSIEQMLHCFRPQFKKYSQGETIMRHSDQDQKIGVIQSGSAQLQSLDFNGNCSFLETYEARDIFGGLFLLPLNNFEYLVTAKEACQVIFLDYQHIITPCRNLCPHHPQLINNLFLMAAEHSQTLSLHLNILSQPTTRAKLMAYLNYTRCLIGENPFTIPMSLSALAEYLCVDRSAMTRELRAMTRQGLLRSDKRTFFLNDESLK